ncbi:hypothetical protein BV22DRAFT_1060350 [Leucogyrophana mollusca]|uniref:Uncharacterized protein n=1 Tax=Leucogyrophana mollusca TaxID=85980 RepID=A0ACB8BQT1_9AGAM|nr:hypothetical protein BV22DRAFT_1060350 [Leucogyrophana mollusca]
MSTASLPGYPAPSPQLHTPSYTASPQPHEYRLAMNGRLRPNRSPGEFIKQGKNGGVSLRLVGQDDHASLPVYGYGAAVKGTVEISKPEGITSVEVKIEGTLKLQEVAEGGNTTRRLCLNQTILWVKDRTGDTPCPSSLSFSLALPTTFSDGDKTYPLPPTYEAHLSGLPGFQANIDYNVGALVVKPNMVPHLVKSALFRKDDWAVLTPFVYHPRTRPAVPIPKPLAPVASRGGFAETPQWRVFPAIILAARGGQDISTKLYLPATRIFCFNQPIPFHLTFSSSAMSLAAFLPLGPVASLLSPKKQYTRIQLLRQTTVDVRGSNAVVMGTKTDIWRVDCIGEGAFRHAGDGPDWISFSGEIFISSDVKIGGFKAGGLSVRDYMVLSVCPPDPVKAPFKELRQVVPIRLATDLWTEDGSFLDAFGAQYGPPSIPSSDELEAAPELRYHS